MQPTSTSRPKWTMQYVSHGRLDTRLTHSRKHTALKASQDHRRLANSEEEAL